MKSAGSKWYVTALIVKVEVIGEREKRPLFDRQIRLLRAVSHEQAYKKAMKLGKEQNSSYKNPSRKLVKWTFVGLAHLDLIREDDVTDGIEVYYTVRRGDPLREVRRKGDLDIFWNEANKHRTQGELTSPSRWRYAPAATLRWVARRIERAKELDAKGRSRNLKGF